MDLYVGKVFNKNGKNYVVTSCSDDTVKLQAATNFGAVKKGRPVNVELNKLSLWLEGKEKNNEFNDLGLNIEGLSYRAIGFCNKSKRLTLQRIDDGISYRGRPKKVYVFDLNASQQKKVLTYIENIQKCNNDLRF
jgi:hypothetical protein